MKDACVQADEAAAAAEAATAAATTQASSAEGDLRQLILSLAPKKKSSWTEGLPLLRINCAALTCPLPDAKGEGAQRATWPKELVAKTFEFLEFASYLSQVQGNQDTTIAYHVRNMSRIGNLVEAQEGDNWRPVFESEISDIRFLCALLRNDLHLKLFELSIFSTKYRWTDDIVGSFLMFCAWQLHRAEGKIVEGADGPWDQYTAAIARVKALVQGSLRKRLAQAKQKQLSDKRAEDAKRIKALPSITEMKSAVAKAFVHLQALRMQYGGSSEPLPPRAQGFDRANKSCDMVLRWRPIVSTSTVNKSALAACDPKQ